jgi:hypothetical protein
MSNCFAFLRPLVTTSLNEDDMLRLRDFLGELLQNYKETPDLMENNDVWNSVYRRYVLLRSLLTRNKMIKISPRAICILIYLEQQFYIHRGETADRLTAEQISEQAMPAWAYFWRAQWNDVTEVDTYFEVIERSSESTGGVLQDATSIDVSTVEFTDEAGEAGKFPTWFDFPDIDNVPPAFIKASENLNEELKGYLIGDIDYGFSIQGSSCHTKDRSLNDELKKLLAPVKAEHVIQSLPATIKPEPQGWRRTGMTGVKLETLPTREIIPIEDSPPSTPIIKPEPVIIKPEPQGWQRRPATIKTETVPIDVEDSPPPSRPVKTEPLPSRRRETPTEILIEDSPPPSRPVKTEPLPSRRRETPTEILIEDSPPLSRPVKTEPLPSRRRETPTEILIEDSPPLSRPVKTEPSRQREAIIKMETEPPRPIKTEPSRRREAIIKAEQPRPEEMVVEDIGVTRQPTPSSPLSDISPPVSSWRKRGPLEEEEPPTRKRRKMRREEEEASASSSSSSLSPRVRSAKRPLRMKEEEEEAETGRLPKIRKISSPTTTAGAGFSLTCAHCLCDVPNMVSIMATDMATGGSTYTAAYQRFIREFGIRPDEADETIVKAKFKELYDTLQRMQPNERQKFVDEYSAAYQMECLPRQGAGPAIGHRVCAMCLPDLLQQGIRSGKEFTRERTGREQIRHLTDVVRTPGTRPSGLAGYEHHLTCPLEGTQERLIRMVSKTQEQGLTEMLRFPTEPLEAHWNDDVLAPWGIPFGNLCFFYPISGRYQAADRLPPMYIGYVLSYDFKFYQPGQPWYAYAKDNMAGVRMFQPQRALVLQWLPKTTRNMSYIHSIDLMDIMPLRLSLIEDVIKQPLAEITKAPPRHMVGGREYARLTSAVQPMERIPQVVRTQLAQALVEHGRTSSFVLANEGIRWQPSETLLRDPQSLLTSCQDCYMRSSAILLETRQPQFLQCEVSGVGPSNLQIADFVSERPISDMNKVMLMAFAMSSMLLDPFQGEPFDEGVWKELKNLQAFTGQFPSWRTLLFYLIVSHVVGKRPLPNIFEGAEDDWTPYTRLRELWNEMMHDPVLEWPMDNVLDEAEDAPTAFTIEDRYYKCARKWNQIYLRFDHLVRQPISENLVLTVSETEEHVLQSLSFMTVNIPDCALP